MAKPLQRISSTKDRSLVARAAAVVSSAVFIFVGCIHQALELFPIEVIGRSSWGDKRFLQPIHGIARQPAIADTEDEKGAHTLVSARLGA